MKIAGLITELVALFYTQINQWLQMDCNSYQVFYLFCLFLLRMRLKLSFWLHHPPSGVNRGSYIYRNNRKQNKEKQNKEKQIKEKQNKEKQNKEKQNKEKQAERHINIQTDREKCIQMVLYLCIYISLQLSLSVSVCLCLCFSPFLSVSLSFSLCLSFSLYVSLSVPLSL